MTQILVVNAGSTNLKLHAVDDLERTERLEDLAGATGLRLAAVAHRIVHGGSRFTEPVVIDRSVRAELEELLQLAPLHNGAALHALDEAQRLFADVPHVGVFDTAFHSTMEPNATTYAIPRRWREELGIRRYGFHGLSVEWATLRAGELIGGADCSLVVCHFGGGSSVTAVVEGRSLDTTMGFSPLEGVPMQTRSGSVDPGALVHVLRVLDLSADALDDALNEESGLQALADGDGDMLGIEQAAQAGDADACLALDVYVHRCAAAIGAMAVAAGGLDALVFTGGIGEHSSLVRGRICERLEHLGVELDATANDGCTGDLDISSRGSRARVLVVEAREELVAARAARRLLAPIGVQPPAAS